jgi:hypothetical protein
MENKRRAEIRGVRTVAGKNAWEYSLFDGATMMERAGRFVAGQHVSHPSETEAVARWILNCVRLPLGSKPQCLTCDCEFSPEGSRPIAFATMRGENGFIVSGVCKSCGHGKTWDDVWSLCVERHRLSLFGGDVVASSPGEGHT